MYVRTYACVYVCMRAQLNHAEREQISGSRTCIYVDIYVCVYEYMYVLIHAGVFMCMNVGIDVCMYV